MALPTGLIPTLVFVLTVGIAAPVTLAAHLFYRSGSSSFRSGFRVALVEAGGLYLVGVMVIWAIAGGTALWEVAATLLVAGLLTLVTLMWLPLLVGQQFVRRVGNADSESALRYATYGWPVTMLVVFGIFVAPGGPTHGHLFSLVGERVCLAGHCGIAVSFATAVLVEIVVAILGPGLVGLGMYSATTGTRNPQTSPKS